jgi:hypothetical protein
MRGRQFESRTIWARRAVATLVLAAGVATLPLVGFPHDNINWQLFARAYDAVTPDGD